MSKIVRGYWDCTYCDTKGIDGLVDACPNCGKRKPPDMRYYMKKKKEYVSDEELQKAGIGKDECDGKHKEWVCPCCQQLNNWSNEDCSACGAPRAESDQEYGDAKQSPTESVNEDTFKNLTDTMISSGSMDVRQTSQNQERKYRKNIWCILAAGIVFLFTFFLWPVKETVTVTGVSWSRAVTVEEERTVKESDWSVPTGGRIYDERTEVSGSRSVLDHYEEVEVQKTREVLDHYDTSYTYTDNGNGTFTENEVQTPVYRTETYTEKEQQPVYRQEPVYSTKYYYEIERWFFIDTYKTSGTDKYPYWSTEYTLSEKQRDRKRSGTYSVIMNDGAYAEEMSQDEWQQYDIGDESIVTKNRFGMVYSVDGCLPVADQIISYHTKW